MALTCVSGHTQARVDVNLVLTRGVVEARVADAIIDVGLTTVSLKAWLTLTAVHIGNAHRYFTHSLDLSCT